MSDHDRNEHAGNGETERVVVRDRRRIDPVTGQVRTAPDATSQQSSEPVGSAAAADSAPAADSAAAADSASASDEAVAALTAEVAERTADLQRVSAEYANYRRRVDRDRQVEAVNARVQVVAELLTVLDDVERAEAHDDLNGPFKAVADKLVAVAQNQGLESFGAEGDEFDPAVHEAVQHETSEATGPTVPVVSTVLRRGYRIADRVLRPAMVAVVDRAV